VQYCQCDYVSVRQHTLGVDVDGFGFADENFSTTEDLRSMARVTSFVRLLLRILESSHAAAQWARGNSSLIQPGSFFALLTGNSVRPYCPFAFLGTSRDSR
jgi:hypothetical protein